MTDRVRIIKHEAVPQCGSFEVRFPDDRPSVYFDWDDLPSRRLRPETLDRETALEKAVARAARIYAIVHQGRLDPGVSLLQKPITQVMLARRIRELLDKA